MANSFFVYVPSNNLDYPDNRPNKFRIHLPKPLYFPGNWVCGLHSISYPYSWPSTILDDNQAIFIHYEDDKKVDRILRIPIPKSSHTKPDKFRDFIQSTLSHQANSLNSAKNDFIEKPSIVSRKSRSVEPKENRKRAPTPPSPIHPKQPKAPDPPGPLQKTQKVTTVPDQQPIGAELKGEKPASKPEEEKPKENPLLTTYFGKKDEQKTEEENPLLTTYFGKKEEKKPERAPDPPTASTETPIQSKPLEKKPDPPDPKSEEKPKENPLLTTFFGKKGEKSRGEKLLDKLFGPESNKKELNLEFAMAIINSLKFEYNAEFERFKAIFNHANIKQISFTPQLGYIFGFSNAKEVKKNETAKYGCDLRGGFSSFAVYTRGLTENMIIGNSLSSLLRVVSISGAIPGEYSEKIYDSPIFVRVLPKEVKEIEIELRTMDEGRLLPMDWGQVLIVLIFKKTIEF